MESIYYYGVLRDELWSVQEVLRGSLIDNPRDAMIATCAAYLIESTAAEDLTQAIQSSNLDQGLQAFLTDEVEHSPRYEDAICKLVAGFTQEELLNYIQHGDNDSDAYKSAGRESTSESLCKLAISILDIKETDTVGDIGCGMGTFLMDVHEQEPGATLQGIEIGKALGNLTKLRLALVKANANITIADAFVDSLPRKCDKVFANFPFGMRSSQMKGNGNYYDIAKGKKPAIGRPASADWIFNKIAVDSLAEQGKAVTLITNGSAVNGGDAQTRKYFIDNGLVQAVIALPEKLLDGTSIPTTLLVLGKNKGSIMMVDATDAYIPLRRKNTLDAECIALILKRLSEEGEYSRRVTKEEIAAADYVFNPRRYLLQDLDLENATTLSVVTTSFGRGIMYKAVDLDLLQTDEDTGINYVRLADIVDGRIQAQRKHLRKLEKNMEKSLLKNGDLLISRNGAPFRITVAEVPEGQTVVAGPNIFILRLDETKVNPYFLAAFFASEEGKESLSRAVVGTTIPNIPINNLKEIEIPLPSLDKQNEIAENYRAALDEIEVLTIKLNKARIMANEVYSTAVLR